MVLGGCAVVVYVVLGPTVVAATSNVLASAISVCYPVGDMVLLVGLGWVLLRGGHASSRRALQLLAVGVAVFVVADLIYGYILLHSVYYLGDPVDAVYALALGVFVIAAAVQAPVRVAEEDTAAAVIPGVSLLPYGGVAVGFVLLIVVERRLAVFPYLVLALTAVALALLVSVRQFLAQRDLTRARQRLSHQAMHDTLTDLPNRALALDRAEQLLARSRRSQTPVAALYVDFDGFRHINDTFGHAAGDRFLQQAASRLSNVIREGDTVARLSGDEFVVLLASLALDAGPELVAE